MAITKIDRVGVLGAGVMGTGIACHLANAGVEAILLDVPLKDGKSPKNGLALKAIDAATRANPKALFEPSLVRLITPGNFDDDMAKLRTCQWVVEAVKEDLKIKQDLFSKVEANTADDTIVSSNTSGIPLALMAEGRSPAFLKRFCITHFFNPVRYLKLLEIVQGPATDPTVIARIRTFSEDVLGKGVVFAKDTPNFIANRIGTYGMMRILKEMDAQDVSVEEVDAIFGRPLGRPKSAIFRTADLVGLDTLGLVAQNCYQNLTKDKERALYQLPDWLKGLIDRGHLGQKSGQGIYKKGTKTAENPKGLEVYNRKSGAYQTMAKVRIDSLGAARNIEDVGERQKAVVFAEDRAGKIAWPVFRDTLAYAMNLVGEIADDVESIDQAMRWGFAWDIGPFESWDALGFAKVAEKMEADGKALAPWVLEIKRGGAGGIYAALKKSGRAQKRDNRRVDLKTLKAEGAPIVKRNDSASLVDIGDGVYVLEFHTKANALDSDIMKLLIEGIGVAEDNGRGLIIYNEGEHFSAGANLMLVYLAAQNNEFGQLEDAIRFGQGAMQRVRYARVPVIAAPSGMALGGGCEMCLAAGVGAGVRPHAEFYTGLVEIGVGLVPSAGGLMNTVFGLLERIPTGMEIDPLVAVAQVFRQVATATVATSAEEARTLGYIPQKSGITMDRRRLLHDAKALAIGLADAGYRPPLSRAFRLPGESGIATLRSMVRQMVQGGQATEHEGKIAGKLAAIVCGGAGGHARLVTEQDMLDLEREAFLSLCGEPKTQERMAYMLTNNKPLRN